MKKKKEHVIVVGGSLGGLMMSLALARKGYTVTVLERADASLRNGAFIRLYTGATHGEIERELRQLASNGNNRIEAWSAIQERLREVVEKESAITLEFNKKIVAIDQDETSAWAITETGERFTGDFLIGADGYRSVVRRYLAPENPFAEYAGYIVWTGKVDEGGLPRTDWKKRELSRPYFDDSQAGTMISAAMPGKDGSTQLGERWIGFSWFDNTHNDLLRELGILKDGVIQRSLFTEDIPESVFQELSEISRRNWPKLNNHLIQGAIEQQALIGTPINEYIPDIIAQNRVAIIGDAAHTMTPMTGSGFNDSLDDTVAIMDSLEKYPDAIPEALRDYQKQRLYEVQQDVLSGQSFSHAFGRD